MGFNHDTTGYLNIDKHTQGTQFTQTQADVQTTQTRHAETALESHEKDALGNRCGGVEGADQLGAGIEFEDTPNQAGADFTTEHTAFHAHGNGGDVDDGEFSGQQEAGLDLDPFDGTWKSQAGNTFDAGDTGWEG